MRKLVFAASVLGILAASGVEAEEVKPFVIVTVTPTGNFVDPKDNPHLEQANVANVDQAIVDALNNAENLGTDTEKLVQLVGNSKAASDFPEDIKSRLEAVIYEWTKPLPASAVDENIAGYTALSNIRPEKETYATKRDKYSATRVSQRKSILKKFAKKVDDFNEITWYTHKNVPRYQDIRPFIALYIGVSKKYTPRMQLQLNYTSRKWLFVESVQANIDGEIVTIPSGEWNRDNDSEIWEWTDIASSCCVDMVMKIAKSKKTVIRFNGQQYYDDYTVTSSDKEAIRDTILAFEVINEGGR